MKTQKNILSIWKLFIVIFFCFNSHAKNHALILGGGEERTSEDEEIMFGSEVQNISRGLGADWQQTILFGSEHNKTDSNGVLSRINLEKSLNNLIKKGQTGDQVLLYISDHGFLPYDNLSENEKKQFLGRKNEGKNLNSQTIGLASTFADNNGLSRPSDRYYSMANLQEVVAELERKGVKVAIVNASCYSGNAMKQFEQFKNLCLMNIAGENSMGFTGGYSDVFAASLAKLKTGTYRWDSTHIPMNTVDYRNSSKQGSLLEFALKALKNDNTNIEVSMLGSSLNSNGHFDSVLKPEGINNFTTQLQKWTDSICKQKSCDIQLRSQTDHQRLNCVYWRTKNQNMTAITSKYKEKEQRKLQTEKDERDADDRFRNFLSDNTPENNLLEGYRRPFIYAALIKNL